MVLATNVILFGPFELVLLLVVNEACTVEGRTVIGALPIVVACAVETESPDSTDGADGTFTVTGFDAEQAIVNAQVRMTVINQSDRENDFGVAVWRYSEAPIEAFEDVTVIVVYPSLI